MFPLIAHLVIGAVLAALLWRGYVLYQAATGSWLDRLSAAWRGSLTVFVLAWGFILSLLINVLDVLAQITGDPEFNTIATSVTAIIPPQFHPWVPLLIPAVGITARLIHNPPTK